MDSTKADIDPLFNHPTTKMSKCLGIEAMVPLVLW